MPKAINARTYFAKLIADLEARAARAEGLEQTRLHAAADYYRSREPKR